MKFLARGLASVLAAFVIYFAYSGIMQSNSGASFNNGGNDLNSQVESLRQHLGYMQSKFGVAFHDFDFAIPAGKKLVVTFVAKLDDKLVPELSGVFHVPTTEKAPDKKGHLSVIFFQPEYQSLSKQSPTCEINFRMPKNNYGYVMALPFDRFSPEDSGGGSTSGGTSGYGALEDDTDYEIWDYEADRRDKSGQPLYTFKYTLNIRLEKLAEGETLDKVTRNNLPAPQ